MRRSILAFGLTFVSLLGCRSGGDPASPSQTPPPAPTAQGRYELTGAVEASGTYDVTYGFAGSEERECAAVATSEGAYLVPVPTITDDHRFNWVAAVASYRGPANYDLSDLGDLKVSVRDGSNERQRTYEATDRSRVELSVEDDNSGTMTFENLAGPNDETLAGDLSWSCADTSD